MTTDNKCRSCVPEIQYQCSEHRPKNQCISCLRTDKELHVSGIGIMCKDCQVKNGVTFW